MASGSDEPKAPQSTGPGSHEEVIEQALQLLAGFDNTPLSQLTPLFYQHAYEELRLITGDLLRILGHDPEATQPQ